MLAQRRGAAGRVARRRHSSVVWVVVTHGAAAGPVSSADIPPDSMRAAGEGSCQAQGFEQPRKRGEPCPEPSAFGSRCSPSPQPLYPFRVPGVAPAPVTPDALGTGQPDHAEAHRRASTAARHSPFHGGPAQPCVGPPAVVAPPPDSGRRAHRAHERIRNLLAAPRIIGDAPAAAEEHRPGIRGRALAGEPVPAFSPPPPSCSSCWPSAQWGLPRFRRRLGWTAGPGGDDAGGCARRRSIPEASGLRRWPRSMVIARSRRWRPKWACRIVWPAPGCAGPRGVCPRRAACRRRAEPGHQAAC